VKIRDVMTPDIDVLSPDDKLRTAARLMADLDFEALPVGEDNKLVGTITGRDIAVQIVADGGDPEATTVNQAMSTDPLYCFENESAEDVARKMGDWWVRRLPVVKQDKHLIGTVSLADLTILQAVSRRSETGKPLHRSRAAHPTRQTRRPRGSAAAAA
jgi:CBS domain-containing protein